MSSYDAVRRYAKAWGRARAAQQKPMCPELCAGEAVSVRLEPRGRADQRHRYDQGGACPAVPQPMLFARLSRESQEMCSTAHNRPLFLQGGPAPRHLRQHEDGGRDRVIGKDASTTAVSCGCADITWSSPVACTPAAAGRRARSRTRSGWCASVSSHALRVASYAELNAWLLDRCVVTQGAQAS